MSRSPRRQLPPLSALSTEPIGKRIAKIRKAKGLTQTELADRIGIDRHSVTNYEIGRLHIYDEMIIRFAIALGVTTDEILGMTPDHYDTARVNRKVANRIQQIEKLPSRQKAALLNTIETYLRANK